MSRDPEPPLTPFQSAQKAALLEALRHAEANGSGLALSANEVRLILASRPVGDDTPSLDAACGDCAVLEGDARAAHVARDHDARSLDAAWKAAEDALPQRNADGKYPPDGRFIVLTGPIASGVYWAHARLFDGNEALREQRRGSEPKGFAPVGAGPAAALLALADALRLAPR